MKFRIGIILAFGLIVTAAYGQSDNTVRVKAFPGNTVGQKVANAMQTCPASGTCFLMIDASLYPLPTGNMPTLCTGCVLQDFRLGLPNHDPIIASINNVVNPMSPAYGAKCDGVTDDSIALQAAIDEAETEASANAPGSLFIPANKTCAFSQTLQVLLSGTGALDIGGAVLGVNTGNGSQLKYTGSGDALQISSSGSGGESIRVHDLTLECQQPGTTTCDTLINLGSADSGLFGPITVERVNFQGNHNAASGTGSGGAAYGIDCLGDCGIQVHFINNGFYNFSSAAIDVRGGTNIVLEGNQAFDSPVGFLLAGAGPVTMEKNYFEAMEYPIEITNTTDWTRGEYDIFDNQENLSNSPPVRPSPGTDPNRRCLYVTNGNTGAEMGAIIDFHDNQCNTSTGYVFGSQGNVPYGVDFELTSPATVDIRASIVNNQFAGQTVSAIYSNTNIPQIDYGDNLVTTDFNRSNTGSFLPQVSGIGAYSPLPGRSTDGAALGAIAAPGAYGLREFQHVFDVGSNNSTLTGTLEIKLPPAVRWSGSMVTVRVTAISDSTQGGSWTLLASGFNGASSWSFGQAAAFGNVPFAQVRFGDDGTHNVLLIGTTTSSWTDLRLKVDAYVSYYSSQIGLPGGWSSGWSDAVLASETGITVSSTPSLWATPAVSNAVPSGSCSGNGYITAQINGYTVHLATCN